VTNKAEVTGSADVDTTLIAEGAAVAPTSTVPAPSVPVPTWTVSHGNTEDDPTPYPNRMNTGHAPGLGSASLRISNPAIVFVAGLVVDNHAAAEATAPVSATRANPAESSADDTVFAQVCHCSGVDTYGVTVAVTGEGIDAS
jgi:hypothetical protein